MKIGKSVFLYLFLFFYGISIGQDLIRFQEKGAIKIGTSIGFYIDSDGSATPENISAKPFVANRTDHVNLGPQQVPVWLRFRIENQTAENLYLHINAPMIEVLELYRADSGGLVQLFQGGIHKPFHQRPIAIETWLFDLYHPQGQAKDYYVKAASGYPLQLPVVLSDKNSFVSHHQYNTLFWGMYFGIALFAFLYNLFIFISVRERTYFYYISYVFTSSLFYLGLAGYDFKFIYPNLPELNIYLIVIICVHNLIVPLFVMRFLQIDRSQKFLYRFGMGLVYFYLILLIAFFFLPFGLTVAIAQLTSLVECLYTLIAGIICLKNGVNTARFFLPAWILFIISLFIYILTDQNVLPSTFFNGHSLFIGHMAEMLLISFALADRINLLKRDNEIKQQEIIRQLEINEKMQLQVNRELEIKVAERTAEVVSQKDKLAIEKANSDKLLLNILPAEIAEELKATGSAEARLSEVTTVLFADIKDFTTVASHLNPQELVADINEIFTRFDRIMEKYDIEKIKTIGDAYMAAGGIPYPKASSPVDTIKAAIEMLATAKEVNDKKRAQGRPPFEVRIGINSGPVVAGIVGIKKFAYDIWGPTVNTASRMESSGEAGKINISAATYELVKDHFHCTYRGKVDAKNIGQIEMYFVEGPK
jgi:class 3 adenylate cyclase